MAGRQQARGHARDASPTGRCRLEHGLYGCGLQCSRKTADHDMARFARRAKPVVPFFHYDITARSEMLPSPANSVVPTAERDRSGLPSSHRRAACSTPRDFMNVEHSLRVFGETLIRLGRGRVRVNNDRIYRDVGGEGHTLGTTRMGATPRRRSSMPTAACTATTTSSSPDRRFSRAAATPTRRITIVALALRLADTLVSTT